MALILTIQINSSYFGYFAGVCDQIDRFGFLGILCALLELVQRHLRVLQRRWIQTAAFLWSTLLRCSTVPSYARLEKDGLSFIKTLTIKPLLFWSSSSARPLSVSVLVLYIYRLAKEILSRAYETNFGDHLDIWGALLLARIHKLNVSNII